ncbi:DUF6515 family protein [Pseudomonas putida]|uniref:Glycine zipper family protein n=1 Tax=Pseudomonas putida TaxID=303 RepID=A0A1Q9R978_PSEPU|nr:DUF6515 family protein [Pseudomonas putida]OLS63862.1 hypothetical protein PSEMO_11760 [Pseudomonas putida]
MTSRIWPLAAIGLLCVSLNVFAEGDYDHRGDDRGRGEQRDQREQRPGGSPLQSKPGEVWQTQEPRQGYYQDIPRRNDGNQHWQTGPRGQQPNWAGRPSGHGNGWGPGPQYRPGHAIDRFPDRYWKVPYRGQDYFYSGGYWYRPHGSGYVVVTPPYGVRVSYLPDYAREMWIGGALFFLVADTYYQYQQASQEYVVVNPPQVQQPAPVQQGSGYDVIAYPMQGQSPQQQEQDRYQCHRWAVDQSGFDPSYANQAPPAQVADTYRRAMGACLAGRGYSVN